MYFRAEGTGTWTGLAPASIEGVTSTAAELNTTDGVTASVAELNLIDGSIAGTAVASKAAVLGADKNLDVLAVLDLKLGAGAGTSVGSSAAEIDATSDLSAFAVARTATALGDGTGLIAERGVIQYVTVTSDSADKIITLPAPTPGRMVILDVGATGFELRSSAPATVAINGGAEADAESAIAANSTCVMVCVSATAWKGFFLDADSDLAKVQAAAAA
jgi:hypothetical protein